MPKVTVLGGGAFRRCLSHEDGTFMNGISPFHVEDTARDGSLLPSLPDRGRGSSPELDPSLQNCEK